MESSLRALGAKQTGQVGGVKYFDILGFDVFQCIDDQGLQFFNVHLISVKMM